MERTDEQLLEHIIRTWISKNINLVLEAQKIAQKILENGLLDQNTLPFQILPTNVLDSDGDTMCNLHLFMDHPIYGFFTIELESERAIITCPNIYHTDTFVTSMDDLHHWIDKLDEEMNSFYNLTENLENSALLNLEINNMLSKYNELIKESLDEIKNYIYSDPRTIIFSGGRGGGRGFYAFANEAVKDFSRALLMPHSWLVFKSVDNLPDMDNNDEYLEDFVDEDATENLFNKLTEFNRKQSYYAAPIFLAQRVFLQGGLKVKGYSETEGDWISAGIGENGEFVLPPIGIEKFEVN
jgi:hypothetical protein